METVVAAAAATLTLTTPVDAVAPFESVARAVIATTPTEEGVQLVEYTPALAVSAVPTTTPPAKNSTFVTVAPPTAEAVAEIRLPLPSDIDDPFAGEVKFTVGAVEATMTETGDDITDAVFESVTRAVSEKDPCVEGIHETL